MPLGFDMLLFLLLYAFLSLLEKLQMVRREKLLCKLGLLYYPMTGRFKENREWNKASEETAAANNVGNFTHKNCSQNLSL